MLKKPTKTIKTIPNADEIDVSKNELSSSDDETIEKPKKKLNYVYTEKRKANFERMKKIKEDKQKERMDLKKRDNELKIKQDELIKEKLKYDIKKKEDKVKKIIKKIPKKKEESESESESEYESENESEDEPVKSKSKSRRKKNPVKIIINNKIPDQNKPIEQIKKKSNILFL